MSAINTQMRCVSRAISHGCCDLYPRNTKSILKSFGYLANGAPGNNGFIVSDTLPANATITETVCGRYVKVAIDALAAATPAQRYYYTPISYAGNAPIFSGIQIATQYSDATSIGTGTWAQLLFNPQDGANYCYALFSTTPAGTWRVDTLLNATSGTVRTTTTATQMRFMTFGAGVQAKRNDANGRYASNGNNSAIKAKWCGQYSGGLLYDRFGEDLNLGHTITALPAAGNPNYLFAIGLNVANGRRQTFYIGRVFCCWDLEELANFGSFMTHGEILPPW